MARKPTKVTNPEKIVEYGSVKVYEELQAGFFKKIPRVKLIKATVKDNKINSISIGVFQNHRKLFDCILSAPPNEHVSLKMIISKLESLATAHSIKILQWPLYDAIFQFCSVDDFK